MISPWANASYYAPYGYIPPRRPREVNARTPLLCAQNTATTTDARIEIARPPSPDRPEAILRWLCSEIAPGAIDALQAPHTASIYHRLQMQIAYAMQRYVSAESHDAQALLRAALNTARQHGICVASIIDTGGVSPLYVALLHNDLSLARDMVQAAPCKPRSDLPLLRACVAARDLDLLDAMLPHKLPPATANAQQSDADAMVEVIESIFDTQNTAFIVPALSLLLTQENAFSQRTIDTWRSSLVELVTRGEPIFSEAWVAQLNRSPRSRAPQPRRVCRQNLVRGFCQSLLKRDDVLSIITHLTPAMRRYALQRTMYTGQLELCRALLSACASDLSCAIG